MDNQPSTTIDRGAVAAAAATLATEPKPPQQTGSNQPQPGNGAGSGNTQQVDPNQPASRNTDPDGGGNGGGGGDGDQPRPPRTERRISQLHGVNEELRKENDTLKAENDSLKQLLENPIDKARVAANVQLPDRSQQQQITTEEYKQDVVNAATQIADEIVKQRLGQILPEQTKRTQAADNTGRVLQEMDAVLDPESPDYIPELDENNEAWDPTIDQNLAADWRDVFKGNPTRSFKSFAKGYVKQRGGRGNTNSGRNQGTTAIRQNAGGGKNRQVSATDIAKMSAAEYAEYLAGRK